MLDKFTDTSSVEFICITAIIDISQPESIYVAADRPPDGRISGDAHVRYYTVLIDSALIDSVQRGETGADFSGARPARQDTLERIE